MQCRAQSAETESDLLRSQLEDLKQKFDEVGCFFDVNLKYDKNKSLYVINYFGRFLADSFDFFSICFFCSVCTKKLKYTRSFRLSLLKQLLLQITMCCLKLSRRNLSAV